MTTKETVLQCLTQADGAAVSGAQMAEQAGVSRAAVGKAICALRDDGYAIDAVTRGGYTLRADGGRLTAAAVTARLRTPGLAVTALENTDSTNTCVRRLAEDGAPEGTVVVAAAQTAGRGRSGKSFLSPAGTGLYMSVLLRPQLAMGDALLITTAAAVAVAHAVERVAAVTAQIKWVNDVYVDGKKVCGILTEGALDLENGGLRYAILGIGINICPPAGGFPPELAPIAGALTETGGEALRAPLAAAVLDEFFALYPHLTEKSFYDDYVSRSLLTGRQIEVLRGGMHLPATALGIDRDLHLRVRYADGSEENLAAGEVSTRPL